MINNTEEKAENLSIEIPRELFEEAGIPTDGELQIYSRGGKIVISSQITDEYICDEDCEYCPCYDECEGIRGRQDEIVDFVASLSIEEQELVQVQLALKQSDSIDDDFDLFDKLTAEELKDLITHLTLRWASRTDSEQV